MLMLILDEEQMETRMDGWMKGGNERMKKY